jgi:hypothetical protein
MPVSGPQVHVKALVARVEGYKKWFTRVRSAVDLMGRSWSSCSRRGKRGQKVLAPLIFPKPPLDYRSRPMSHYVKNGLGTPG